MLRTAARADSVEKGAQVRVNAINTNVCHFAVCRCPRLAFVRHKFGYGAGKFSLVETTSKHSSLSHRMIPSCSSAYALSQTLPGHVGVCLFVASMNRAGRYRRSCLPVVGVLRNGGTLHHMAPGSSTTMAHHAGGRDLEQVVFIVHIGDQNAAPQDHGPALGLGTTS